MPETSPGRRTRRLSYFLLAIILLYAAGVRAWTLDLPFNRNLEGLSAFYGVLARNYFRHDLSTTYGVPVQSMGQSEDARVVFYGHHPPLVPLFIAGSYRLFDDPYQADYVPAEWMTRLPTALFTLACIVTIYLMVRNRASERAALVAAALFAAAPMTVYFGGAADVINPQLVFFILLTIAAYLRFHERPGIGRLLLLCAAFAPAGYTDWPAYFIVVVLTLHYAFTRPWKSWGWIVGFGAFSVAWFAAVYGQVYLTNGDWRWIAHLVEKRTVAEQTDQRQPFDTWLWLTKGVIAHNVKRHTWPVMILAGMWTSMFIWRRNIGSMGTLVRILLGWAALHAVIGRQGVYQHEWWWWPLTPGLVVCAGLMVDWFCAHFERWGISNAREQSGDEIDRLRFRCAQDDGASASHCETASGRETVVSCEVRSARRIALGVVVAILLVAFACWTTPRGLGQFEPDGHMGDPHYSTKELGDAVRAAAAPNGAVVIADRDPDSLSIWYYADRPILLDVWDAWTLEQAASDPQFASLPWLVRQPWPHPAQGMVIPKAYLSKRVVMEFAEELKEKYAWQETEKFLIVDLTSTRKTQ
jgi:hypothetical protein